MKPRGATWQQRPRVNCSAETSPIYRRRSWGPISTRRRTVRVSAPLPDRIAGPAARRGSHDLLPFDFTKQQAGANKACRHKCQRWGKSPADLRRLKAGMALQPMLDTRLGQSISDAQSQRVKQWMDIWPIRPHKGDSDECECEVSADPAYGGNSRCLVGRRFRCVCRASSCPNRRGRLQYVGRERTTNF